MGYQTASSRQRHQPPDHYWVDCPRGGGMYETWTVSLGLRCDELEQSEYCHIYTEYMEEHVHSYKRISERKERTPTTPHIKVQTTTQHIHTTI